MNAACLRSSIAALLVEPNQHARLESIEISVEHAVAVKIHLASVGCCDPSESLVADERDDLAVRLLRVSFDFAALDA